MATQEAQDAAARERIIKHMNADHHDSVRRYLEASEAGWWFQYSDARMTDIDLNAMQFAYSGKQTSIPFSPPLKSFREARERLVQMDKDALVTLGRSDTSITSFIPPYTQLSHFINFSVCLTTYLAFFKRSHFAPGSLLFNTVLHKVPSFANFCFVIQPYLFWIMIGIHVTEATLMVRKLQHHGLAPFSRLWLLWVGTCLVEGITSFKRLDRLIEEKKKEKEAKKH